MTPPGGYAVGLLLFGAAAVSALVRTGWAARLGLLLLAVAEALLAWSGVEAVLSRSWSLDLGDLLGFPTTLHADPLSGFFLTLMGVVGAFSCLVAAAPARRTPEPLGTPVALAALMLLAVAVTVTAADAFTLLLAWETISFTFYALSGYRGTSVATRAGLVSYAFAKTSGAALMVGLLLLAAGSGHLQLAELGHGTQGATRGAAYALLLLAFAVKVGLVPVHLWMPAAYETAPATLRALMAGVAVNAGFYGLWRTVEILGRPPVWLVVVVLVVASFTALLGIAHAAVQTHLSRVVGWSSVENAGLITVGLGVAMVGAVVGDPRLVAVGLLAGTLQMVTHAFAKALLFSSTATIEGVRGTSDINRLQGAARRSPYSGTGFVVGSLTLAALPPTIGFASEWFLLESLMQQFRVEDLTLRLTLALAGALVALTAGFAGVAFVRLVGYVALGRPADPAAGDPRADVGTVGRIGLLGLVAGCLGVAVVSPLEIAFIAHSLTPLVPATTSQDALASPWVLQPVFAQFSVLSPTWLWVTMPLLFVLVLVAAAALSRGSMFRVRRVAPWRSASGEVVGEPAYTAFGFSNPTRKVLANVLLTRSRLVALERSTAGQVGDEDRGAAGAHLGYTSDVVEVVERYVYRPLRKPSRFVVRQAKRLQSGRLDAYVTYVLIAVVAMLAVAAALG